jgi:hypothetical protein
MRSGVAAAPGTCRNHGAELQRRGGELNRWLVCARRKRFDEDWSHARRDHGLSIRLVEVARDLREELTVGDSGGGVEARHFLYPRTDHGGDLDPLLVHGTSR